MQQGQATHSLPNRYVPAQIQHCPQAFQRELKIESDSRQHFCHRSAVTELWPRGQQREREHETCCQVAQPAGNIQQYVRQNGQAKSRNKWPNDLLQRNGRHGLAPFANAPVNERRRGRRLGHQVRTPLGDGYGALIVWHGRAFRYQFSRLLIHLRLYCCVGAMSGWFTVSKRSAYKTFRGELARGRDFTMMGQSE